MEQRIAKLEEQLARLVGIVEGHQDIMRETLELIRTLSALVKGQK